MKSKGFTLIELLAVIVILAIIALIATPIILNIIEDTKESSRLRSIENIEHAAELYIASEINLKDGEIPESITIRELKENGYLTEIEENENNKIFIKISNEEYDIYYEGRDKLDGYKSLKELVENNNNIKRNVKINGNIVNKIYGTKDEQTTMKNYVLYSGQLFEVIETNDTINTIKLVSASSLTAISYGQTNDFSTSWVKKWLNEVFLSSLERKDIIKDTEFCIDNIDVVPSEYTKMETCTNKINEKVGLLTYEDYIYALDGENIQDGGSFLDEDEFSYLITPTSIATNEIWHTNYTNISNLLTTAYKTNSVGLSVRPVISIKDDVLVKSGNGTKRDPYILSVERSLDKNQKLNLAKVGDYVYMDESNNPYVSEFNERYIGKLTNKTTTDKVRYRIVNINQDGSIKLERTDILRNLPNEMTNVFLSITMPFYSLDSGDTSTSCLYDAAKKYGESVTNYTAGCKGHNIFNPEEGEGNFEINTGDSVPYFLNNADNSFYKWYSDKAKSMIIKTMFSLDVGGVGKDYSNLNTNPNGTYPNNTNDGIIEAYVGLPYLGEMYTGNDINENFWYVNRYGNIYVSATVNNGSGYATSISYYGGVRPVITLSPNIYVTEGNGTVNNPYVLDI